MSKVSAFNSKVGIRINQELQFSKELLDALPPAISIYGGARLKRDDPYYAKTFALAKAISQAGIPVISGGGTGVMEAANQGAQAGGDGLSVGLTIRLPFEAPNEHHDISLMFEHFASRKITFCRHSRAFVCMPGGVGTLDELFEVLTLIQTGKMDETPVILFGSDFWSGLLGWLRDTVLARGLISALDLEHRLQVVDTVEHAMQIILAAHPESESNRFAAANELHMRREFSSVTAQ
jgi:uncharacterized protein (TIGR00730 family)